MKPGDLILCNNDAGAQGIISAGRIYRLVSITRPVSEDRFKVEDPTGETRVNALYAFVPGRFSLVRSA